MQEISQRDRDIWRAAITLAHNLCVQRSNDLNDDDGPTDRIHESADCAAAIRGWLEPEDAALEQMFQEVGVSGVALPDDIAWALNSGDGSYLP